MSGYDKISFDVGSGLSKVLSMPGGIAAKTVTFGTTPETGVIAATGVLTSNNTNVSNADTVTIGTNVYTFKTVLTETHATATITDGNGTNVSDGDTVTIGSITYRFKTVMLAINDVQIGASADASAQSLIYAINAAGTPGTDYFIGITANASVTAGTLSAHAFTVTAKVLGTAGNSVVISKVAASISLGNATGGHLNSGVDSIANEVVLDGGASADVSLTRLAAAINGTTGAGTTYSTATITNAQVTSSAVVSHAITITAITAGEAGNLIATTKSAATLSWGSATLTGGTEALTLFTVTGDVLYAVFGICTVSLAGASAQLEAGFVGNLAAALPLFTATSLTANKIVDSTGVISAGTAPAITPVRAVSGQVIKLTELTAEVTSGAVNFYCIYIPLSAGAKVVTT